jgi:hypothetical protein
MRWCCGNDVVLVAAVVIVVIVVYDVGENRGRQLSGTRGGRVCRVGYGDFLSGEDHGTPCIAEYSHAEEIVCNCRHDDGTGVSARGQKWYVNGSCC